MRLWTLHPRYLDRQGLVALWREALLAQKVLQGQATGYRHHPQLVRFRAMPDPVAVLATYLAVVYEEATRRGYRFAASKMAPERSTATLTAADRQLLYEWNGVTSSTNSWCGTRRVPPAMPR
jgi:Pyrimidine dimer DNA glycosylase